MRPTLLSCFFAAAAATAAGASCGKPTVATPPNAIRSVSGHVLTTALDPQGGPPLSPNALTVAAYNPNTLLLSSTPASLESVTLDANDCQLAAGCPYLFNTVNFARLTIGLLTRVGPPDDDNATWTKAYTWVADANTTRAALDGNMAVPNTRSYALSTSAMARLQAITGVAPATLLARGVLVGVVQGAASEAKGAQGEPPAVAGATVNTDAAAQVDITYASDTLEGPNNAAKTGASGMFVAVAKAARPVVNIWRVVPPTGDSAHRWSHSPVAGTFPGRVTVLMLQASAN